MPIDSFMRPGGFDSEAVAAMSEAFDAACNELQNTDQPEVMREIIATRIIAAARRGERDPACWKLLSLRCEADETSRQADRWGQWAACWLGAR
jgi:hypothetical protein